MPPTRHHEPPAKEGRDKSGTDQTAAGLRPIEVAASACAILGMLGYSADVKLYSIILSLSKFESPTRSYAICPFPLIRTQLGQFTTTFTTPPHNTLAAECVHHTFKLSHHDLTQRHPAVILLSFIWGLLIFSYCYTAIISRHGHLLQLL